MVNLAKKAERASSSARHLINKSSLGFTTQRDYKRVLDDCITILHRHSYFIDNIRQLKQKHINCLMNEWRASELTTRTIKNKLSVLRFACDAMRKPNVVLDNKDYDLPAEKKTEKQRAIFNIDLSQFSDTYVSYAVALQQAFGLRREEAMKFNPCIADKGSYIQLKASWTKGGIQRDVPVTTEAQRKLLDDLYGTIGNASLIPPHLNYIQQRTRYDDAVKKSGYHNLHGLRYAYAQSRYLALTGWPSPKQGGKLSKDMSEAEKIKDREVRLIISRELGHVRKAILEVYI